MDETELIFKFSSFLFPSTKQDLFWFKCKERHVLYSMLTQTQCARPLLVEYRVDIDIKPYCAAWFVLQSKYRLKAKMSMF